MADNVSQIMGLFNSLGEAIHTALMTVQALDAAAGSWGKRLAEIDKGRAEYEALQRDITAAGEKRAALILEVQKHEEKVALMRAMARQVLGEKE